MLGPAAFLTLAASTSTSGVSAVFIDAAEAKALFRERDPRVLDARGDGAEAPFFPSAVTTSWRDVRAGLLRDGRLTNADEARAHYEGRGVRRDRPVLVYGAAHEGWGEEGRVWWDLRVLGHPEVYILDGGIAAWTKAGGRVASTPSAPLPGAFEPSTPGAELRADHERVLELSRGSGVVLDTRSREEFEGATPYASARGGHVPGARHLAWKSLLGPEGRLLPRPELEARLVEAGIERGRRVAAYCTGGVRSAFVVAVLTHLGLSAENYDGSWWDWSARAELPVADGAD